MIDLFRAEPKRMVDDDVFIKVLTLSTFLFFICKGFLTESRFNYAYQLTRPLFKQTRVPFVEQLVLI